RTGTRCASATRAGLSSPWPRSATVCVPASSRARRDAGRSTRRTARPSTPPSASGTRTWAAAPSSTTTACASSDRGEPRRRGRLSAAARTGETKRGHLLAVPDEQDVPDEHGMVPRLAVDRGEARDLGEAVGLRRDQRQLAFLGQHEQQILVRQEEELSVAVPP